jgi:pyruvate formate-lyase activating enzyme-like uncharacterized protein
MGDPNKALVTGPLPRGCELCFLGLKATIFITGLCDDRCFYCPVSKERLGRDVIYVNEEKVSSLEEIVVEVERQGALGASITGGDPLLVPERTVEVIRRLKETFGSRFHIHLYTSGRYATPSLLRELCNAGLDEIRFHPTRREFLKRIRQAAELSCMDVGAEIPIAPGFEEWAKKVIKEVERAGGSFVNLDEMEFVAPNAEALMLRGYTEDPLRPFTVKGSLEAALKVLKWASENVSITVHFCPASFKDSIQTKNRLRATARKDRTWFEVPTASGTLMWGELRGLKECPEGTVFCNEKSEKVCCTLPDVKLLKEIARKYGGKAYIVEALPTRKRRPVMTEIEVE